GTGRGPRDRPGAAPGGGRADGPRNAARLLRRGRLLRPVRPGRRRGSTHPARPSRRDPHGGSARQFVASMAGVVRTMTQRAPNIRSQDVRIPADHVELAGILALPEGAEAIVLFAHGSGSGRLSPRNQHVARVLQEAGLATLLFDLLSEEEAAVDERTGHLRIDIGLLAGRLVAATDWVRRQEFGSGLPIGYFGASTGAAAALVAAARRPGVTFAVVSRGGRPDLARFALAQVRAPTLLIVGERDEPVIDMNR